MSERSYRSYKRDLVKINNKKLIDGVLLDYEDAENEIVDYLSQKKMIELDFSNRSDETKTKEYLKDKKREIRQHVIDCIYQRNISIRGYQDDKIDDFIDEMVAEYAGYSILEEAFLDESIDDIYCIDWQTIFVEKDGENVKYWKTFRDKKHYATIVERFMRETGKEINMGDSKIVDFELYGNRGCAISPAISPRDYSLTLRKHKEEHIILDQLLEGGIMNEEMSEFFGMLIDGEMNIIYAGLTGSGKTTTIRALIDYYVSRNGKRMLVCEDTQELFPKNEHTVELVSFKSDKSAIAVPLHKLIITALRLKPKYIVVGEVRGEEAQAAVEAMETGHSTIFTMHGGTPLNIINRLVTKYLMAMPSLGIDVVERIIGASVDYIAIQDHIPDIGRICSGIYEISYDFDTRRTAIKTIFEYDFEINDFMFFNRISHEKKHKLLRRGIKRDYLKKWVTLVEPDEDDQDKIKECEKLDKQFVKEFNDNYLKEKPARLEMYAKRKKEREEAYHTKRIEEEKNVRFNQNQMNKAKIIEGIKARELEDMLRKTELIKQQTTNKQES